MKPPHPSTDAGPVAAPEAAGGPRSDAAASDVVVRLEDVTVCYRVPLETVSSLKEYVISRLKGKGGNRTHRALDRVSLEVRSGEVFALVGHNGAGKTTLLKTVARVLRPTSGRIRVFGRVVPLLQLGAGFHPELTGRENILLNATLLGHSRRDTLERLDSIIDFARIGDFIDAPLRTYSSGMAARVGFAVATAWKPDILILDEALAVGDEAFQRTCRERIQAFRDAGVTVLLVSHGAETVLQMSDRAAWLDHGTLQAVGEPRDVVRAYKEAMRRR